MQGEHQSLSLIDRHTKQIKIIARDFECISLCTIPSFDVKKVQMMFARDREKVYAVDLKHLKLYQMFRLPFFDGCSQQSIEVKPSKAGGQMEMICISYNCRDSYLKKVEISKDIVEAL